jgi:threonylcarbamoyladenosine tRNA methylthiotransferase MtaB
MRRQYGTEEFLRAVELIKSQLDRPAITTDIIVGFPGETDADFEATVNLAREAGFAKMHVFSFSPRAGTAAAEMQGAVNSRVIKSRSQTLRDLNSELEYKFRQQFIGEKDEILLEESKGECKGRSKRYFVVRLEKTNGNLQKGGIVRVKLVENSKNGVSRQLEDK